MSATPGITDLPLGWSVVDRQLVRITKSALFITVAKHPKGGRYVEIYDDDKVVFGDTLTDEAAAHLAALLTN